jgi:CRP/FNR family transcriptional regulator, cyclic AMP receptor protein
MLASVSRSPLFRTNVLKEALLAAAPNNPATCRYPLRQSSEPVVEWDTSSLVNPSNLFPEALDSADTHVAAVPEQEDPLYLFARFLDWEQEEEPSAAWELLAAAQSSHSDTRAHARALLATSRHLYGASGVTRHAANAQAHLSLEIDMNTPCEFEIEEKCSGCGLAGRGFFCNLSEQSLRVWDEVTHKSTLPAGAILFVEGQNPRGMFVICSGRVNLSTTSKEGKLLLLRTAAAGEAIGLSASISGLGYEVTAETATDCQVSFVDLNHVLELMQSQSEFGMQAARSLSHGFHEAYRDIRDLMLSKTSAGKLARLLLSQLPVPDLPGPEIRIPSSMTHEEMAHRIGASRETVTRLLTNLKKKHLIRLDGPTLVIRDRTALEALTT